MILFSLVVIAYLLPGMFGHGPWKQDETYSFGIIHNMIVTGDYLVPTNAGQPFMEKPPLFYWTAAIFAKLLYPLFPYDQGAKFATLFYMIITLVFAIRIAKTGWQENTLFTPSILAMLALFTGTAGMIKHAHDLFTDVALVTGSTIALYGLLRIVMNLANHTPSKWDGFWFGLGCGIAFLAKGLLVPGVYAITVLLIPILYRQCRSLAYVWQIIIALVVTLPFVLIWPILLAQHSEPLFMKWFWDNNVGRFLGFSVPELGAGNINGLAWKAPFEFLQPTVFLVILGLLTGTLRKTWQPIIGITLIFTVVMTALLLKSATARHLYYLPLALPFAILSIPALEQLPARLHTIWDWFSRCFFGILIIALWFAFIVSAMPVEYHHLVKFLGKYVPLDFVSPVNILPLLLAIAITAGWMLSLPRLKDYPQWRGAFSWFGGITVMWGVAFTVILPWLDQTKSYEYIYHDLAEKIAPAWKEGDCMASYGLGESEAPTLYYYTGIMHKPYDTAEAQQCRWVIVQQQFNIGKKGGGPEDAQEKHTQTVQALVKDWTPFWEGRRAQDRNQILRVFTRTTTATSSH